MGEKTRAIGWLWLVSLAGAAMVIASYWAKRPFWLGVGLNGGIALALFVPVSILGRGLAAKVGDDVAVQVADAQVLETEPEGTDLEAQPAGGPAASYEDLMQQLRQRGFERVKAGDLHDAWRRGDRRVVVNRGDRRRGPDYYGRVLRGIDADRPRGEEQHDD